MDGGNIDPKKSLPINSKPEETESAHSPTSPEHQRYTPQGSPKYRSEQKQVSADYDISSLPESLAPLPDECPDWFLPWQDIYNNLADMEGYFQSPDNQKAFLDGRGFGYNLTILIMMKWDNFPGDSLPPEQIDLVDEWIQSCLANCPIPLGELPRELNHLNKTFKPSPEDKKRYFESEQELEAASFQKEEQEFVPEWMSDTLVLGLSPHDAFRQYWDVRNQKKHYRPGATFLTPERLKQLNDPLYCWMAKFRHPETGRAANLRDDQIELVWSRLQFTDDVVNKAIKGKKNVEIYNWNTMRLVDTEEDRERRIDARMKALQQASPAPMDIAGSQPEPSETADDFTVRIPLNHLKHTPASGVPGAALSDLYSGSEESGSADESFADESSADESFADESFADESFADDSDSEFIPGMKRPRKQSVQSANKAKRKKKPSPSHFDEASSDSLGSSRSSSVNGAANQIRRRPLRRKHLTQSTTTSSLPQSSRSPSSETGRRRTPADNISFDYTDNRSNELKKLKELKDLDELKFLGVFQNLSPEKQQALLEADDVEWLKQVRFQHFPEHKDHAAFPIASLKDDALPSARQQSDPSTDKSTRCSELPSLISAPDTSSVVVRALEGGIPVPAELLNMIGMSINPPNPDNTMLITTGCDILAQSVETLRERLIIFPEIQKQVNNLTAHIREAEEEEKDASEQKEQLTRIKQRTAPLVASTLPLLNAMDRLAGTIQDHITLLSKHQENDEHKALFAELAAADTELAALKWNSKKFARLKAFEKWQLLPETGELCLKHTRKSVQALPAKQTHSETLEEVPEKLNKLPQKVLVPLSCLNSVKTNWKDNPAVSEMETSSAPINTAKLAHLVVKGTKSINKTFLTKGEGIEHEGRKKYTDLARLMKPLIEAYSSSLPSDDQTLQEYQALISLQYHCLLFSDALQSRAHTSRANTLQKEMKKHASALSRLGSNADKSS